MPAGNRRCRRLSRAGRGGNIGPNEEAAVSDLTITATHMVLRGAQGPVEILEERLGGRLLVAGLGKANRWLVLDRAPVPAALAKRLPDGVRVAGERIVVPAGRQDEIVALVESWVLDGTEAKDARRAAAARKAAGTRAANATARRVEEARLAEQADVRAAAAIASGVVSYDPYGGKLRVRTPYDERVVAAMRGIRGSRWDADARVWTVPPAAHAALAPLVPRLNAWAAEKEEEAMTRRQAAAQTPAGHPAATARPAKPRRLFPLDQAPKVGSTVRWAMPR